MGSGPVPGTWAGFLELIPHAGLPHPALMQGAEGAWSYLNLMCHALLMPMKGLPLSEETDGGKGRGEAIECKINKKI